MKKNMKAFAVCLITATLFTGCSLNWKNRDTHYHQHYGWGGSNWGVNGTPGGWYQPYNSPR